MSDLDRWMERLEADLLEEVEKRPELAIELDRAIAEERDKLARFTMRVPASNMSRLMGMDSFRKATVRSLVDAQEQRLRDGSGNRNAHEPATPFTMRAARFFDWMQGMIPRRLSSEDVGDLLERIHVNEVAHGSRLQRWILAGFGVAGIVLNIVRWGVAGLRGKGAPKTK